MSGADIPVPSPQDPGDWSSVFREASWEEALDKAAGTLRGLRDRHGAKALAGLLLWRWRHSLEF